MRKMTRWLDPAALAGLLLAILLLNPGCASHSSAGPVTAADLLTTLCPVNPPELNPRVPGDSPLLGQPAFDCFAWQEFIALNWPARKAGPAELGKPGDTRPVVWETYMDVHGVMREDAQPPIPWGESPPIPDTCKRFAEQAGGARVLRMTSKFHVDFEESDDFDEAAPTNNPNWLADRDGNLVWYEILIDQPEYDYIVQNGFYNADTQARKVLNGVHIDLPRGVYQGPQGAMELKAAWLTVKDPKAEKWRRYKLSQALAYDPRHDTCDFITVALVGLHILHKTETQPQWTWATFEHVDNAPDRSQVATAGDRFTFYRSDCQPQPVPAHCQNMVKKSCQPPSGNAQTSCKPNTAPAYCLHFDQDQPDKQCLPYPIQVVREMPIPDSNDNPIRRLNRSVQEMYRKANPDSVWQHYQLVNVLWSDSPVDENLAPKPSLTPLSQSGLRPSPPSFPVANAVMETYVQNLACVDCHSDAAIADAGNPAFASDYTFVLGMADSPKK